VRVATQYAFVPASLTIISCKYETVKYYNLPLNSLKQKRKQHCYFIKFVPTLSKQSKAQQNMGAGYAFLPIKQVDL